MGERFKANKWLWITSALLAIAVVGVLIIPRDGHNFEVDGICYEIVNDKSNIVKVTYKGGDWNTYQDEYSGVVVIPEELTIRVELTKLQRLVTTLSVAVAK